MSKLLIFRSKGRLFGLDVAAIGEILPLKGTVDLPTSGKIMTAGVNVRGRTIPLFDFRVLIGDQPLLAERQELVHVLNQREQDHIDWLEALEKSVQDGSEFRKALNPRACAFGKWFYSYKAPDSAIDRVLRQFEEPHNAIHGLAETVLSMSRKGDLVEARKLITGARNTTLAGLLRLFGELKNLLVTELRNLFILLNTPSGFTYALCVDGVENVRDPEAEKMHFRSDCGVVRLVKAIWSTSDVTICEIDVPYLHSLIMSDRGEFGLSHTLNDVLSVG